MGKAAAIFMATRHENIKKRNYQRTSQAIVESFSTFFWHAIASYL